MPSTCSIGHQSSACTLVWNSCSTYQVAIHSDAPYFVLTRHLYSSSQGGSLWVNDIWHKLQTWMYIKNSKSWNSNSCTGVSRIIILLDDRKQTHRIGCICSGSVASNKCGFNVTQTIEEAVMPKAANGMPDILFCVRIFLLSFWYSSKLRLNCLFVLSLFIRRYAVDKNFLFKVNL